MLISLAHYISTKFSIIWMRVTVVFPNTVLCHVPNRSLHWIGNCNSINLYWLIVPSTFLSKSVSFFLGYCYPDIWWEIIWWMYIVLQSMCENYTPGVTTLACIYMWALNRTVIFSTTITTSLSSTCTTFSIVIYSITFSWGFIYRPLTTWIFTHLRI